MGIDLHKTNITVRLLIYGRTIFAKRDREQEQKQLSKYDRFHTSAVPD